MGHASYICYLLLIGICTNLSYGGELTFELPDNERQCFFESIDKSVKCTIEFQVITGGHYDVDLELMAPNGQILYKDVKKQYDSFTWTTDQKGVYKFCFSNEFSTFSHKVVYFDFQVGEENPLGDIDDANAHHTAMTMMEYTSASIYKTMISANDHQKHFRARETKGRIFAEDLNSRVMYWSIGESVIIFLIGMGQVFILRSFFTEKKTSGLPVSSM